MNRQSLNRTLIDDTKRLMVIVVASIIMAVNLKSFVHAGGLFPGGFNGLTLLIQRIADQFFGIKLTFSAINLLLNAIPAVISYKFIGKRFTILSCIMIALTGFLTDIIPIGPITQDVLLICIFGGMINGFAISLCLFAHATSGGTDFIAVALSEKLNVDAWNYILAGNALMLVIAGVLFGWDKALYSIIFQFASTQVVQLLNLRYKRHTLFIISDKAEAIYEAIRSCTQHGATMFQGIGLYQHETRKMIYSVVSSDEVKEVLKTVRAVDANAFINVVKTDQLSGRFHKRPND
ncbi:MAG: YitT family protein [Eubacterium sp.]|nr:YitT family protein [Eubacterium sp.]